MSEPRIRAAIWISAQVRLCDVNMMQAVVRRRGDPDAGSIILRLDRLNGHSVVLSQARDAAGNRAWLIANGGEPLSDADVESYIDRRVASDPDIWVLEIEDRHEKYELDAPVIT